MEFLEGTKDFFLQNGATGLFIISFAEAFFFPIPPDVVLIPLSVLSPGKALFYAGITSIASALGGVLSYFIGNRAGRPILLRFAREDSIKKMEDLFYRYGAWAVAIAGFTPIPDKVFNLACGVFGMNLATFFIVLLLSKSARFFLESGIVMAMGENAMTYINKLLGPGSFILVAVAAIIYIVAKKSRVSPKIKISFIEKLNKSSMAGYLKKRAGNFISIYGEFGIYLIGGIITAGLFGAMFVKLVTEMREKEMEWLDQGLINILKSIKSPFFIKIMDAVSLIQHPCLVLFLLALSLLWAQKLYKNIRYPVMILTVFAGSLIIQWGFKSLFQRPRLLPTEPPLDFLAYSFPSGTLLIFTAFIGYWVFLFLRKSKRTYKVLAVALGLIMLCLLSINRIYMGASYPTDIVAGFFVGMIWLISCIIATLALEYYSR